MPSMWRIVKRCVGFNCQIFVAFLRLGRSLCMGLWNGVRKAGVRVAVVVSGSGSLLKSVEGVTERHFDGFVMCGMGDLLDQLEVEIMFV